MPTIPRRVVTGHDGRGASVFAADGPVPVVRTAPDGALFYEVWGTDAMPAPISAAAPDPTVGALTVPPPPNGTKIRINEFPPGVVSPVHRTQSVDYGLVLDGEVVLVLDDSETTLRAGFGQATADSVAALEAEKAQAALADAHGQEYGGDEVLTPGQRDELALESVARNAIGEAAYAGQATYRDAVAAGKPDYEALADGTKAEIGAHARVLAEYDAERQADNSKEAGE